MVPLNYNQLYTFYKIAELGSIARASKALLVSSPALSMQLRELEENLQTQLFLRSGRNLVLTESGSIVFEYARDIFKLGVELRDTIDHLHKGKERLRIEVGCQDSVPKKVADALVSFLIEGHQCKVVLKEGKREQLLEMQNHYKLDLILTNSVPAVDDSIIYGTKLLLREELVIVGHPKFKKLAGRVPGSLNGSPFILPTFDSSLRHKLDGYFRSSDLDVDIVAEVEDKSTEIDLALRGHGLITVMKKSISHLLESKLLIELGPMKGIQEEIWMIVGKRKILNPLALLALKSFEIHR